MKWSVLERNVRSDANTRDERLAEESQFIVAARAHAERSALVGQKVHVALREGEFVEAAGFSINEDRRMAELSTEDLFEERSQADAPKVVKLVGGCWIASRGSLSDAQRLTRREKKTPRGL